MTYKTLLLVIMALLISKPLFAICQKHIFPPFTASGPSNFYSMFGRLIWEADAMAARELVIAVYENYENWTVQNL